MCAVHVRDRVIVCTCVSARVCRQSCVPPVACRTSRCGHSAGELQSARVECRVGALLIAGKSNVEVHVRAICELLPVSRAVRCWVVPAWVNRSV